jgi:pyruvate/2-oxoglutarate dehydrogenase complex dihydrolipoamide dehydrogenase (E3) component
LNWGCIPTKALLRNAEIYHLMQHSADFGLYCDNLRFDFSRVIARSRQVAERLSQGIAFLMRKNKIPRRRYAPRILCWPQARGPARFQVFPSIKPAC